MKKNRSIHKKSTSSGICIFLKNNREERLNSKILIFAVHILLVLSGALGALCSFASAFNFSEDVGIIFQASLICSLVFVLLYEVKKIRIWIFPVSLVLILLVGLFQKDLLFSQGEVLWNRSLSVLSSSGIGNLPTINESLLYNTQCTDIWIFSTALITSFLGFFIVVKPHFIPVLLITFLPMEAGLYYGLVPDLFSVICFFACNSSVLAICIVNSNRKKQGKKRLFKISATYKSKAVISLIMCIFFSLSLTAFYWGFSVSDFQRPDIFDEMRDNFNSYNFQQLLNKSNVALDLSLQGNRKYDNQTDLTAELTYNINRLYLKSVTGSVYSENKWLDLDASAYRESVISQMKERELTVSDIFSSQYPDSNNLSVIKITPQPELSQNTYLPYGFYNSGNLSADTDKWAMISDNKGEYTVTFDKSVNDLFKTLMLNDSFKRTTAFYGINKAYSDFVKKYYTQLPENELPKLLEDAEKMKEPGNNDSVQTMNYVKKAQKYLNENAKYSLEPGNLPAGKDFTEYFLYESKKGYCVHFATAGVLMLRALGVPCRYASGYVVKENDYENSQSKEQYQTAYYLENGKLVSKDVLQNTQTIYLKDSNAHAWAEVYIDGIGWFPCEMTPGIDGSSQGENTEPLNTESTQNTELQPTGEVSEETTLPAESNPAQDIQSTSESSYGINNKQARKGFPGVNVLIISLAVIGAAVVYVLTGQLLKQKRKSRFHSNNNRKNVLVLYEYFVKVLKFSNCKRKKYETLKEFFHSISVKFDFVDENDIDLIIDIIQKAYYGNSLITKDEQQKFERFVMNFVNRWTNQQTVPKKILYKYILFLV